MRHLRTCCFIDCSNYGNLSMPSEDYARNFRHKLKEIIENLINNFNVSHFISGMELGFEQTSAEILNELKVKYPKVTLEAVLPYENFSINWNEEERDKYYSLMQNIDKETLLQYHYTKDCIRKRNIFMVNKSNYLILLSSDTSEIYNFILYAKHNKKAVFIIQPNTINNISQIRIHR
ncbi:MAG: DUF1273 domain-containing protein [Tissierellia bacterium]|nr:DUF1273 domain-containing protein [Tissierellia bacterium]